MIKLKRITSVDVTCIKGIGSAYKILVGKLQRKQSKAKSKEQRQSQRQRAKH
jgi:hypothetical protein